MANRSAQKYAYRSTSSWEVLVWSEWHNFRSPLCCSPQVSLSLSTGPGLSHQVFVLNLLCSKLIELYIYIVLPYPFASPRKLFVEEDDIFRSALHIRSRYSQWTLFLLYLSLLPLLILFFFLLPFAFALSVTGTHTHTCRSHNSRVRV